MIKHANEDNFQSLIANGVVLVDFWAEWCGPCKMISPVLEQIAEDFEGKVTVVKVNIEEAREVSDKLGIMSIPTLQVYVDGEKKEEKVGFLPKEVLAGLLENHLS